MPPRIAADSEPIVARGGAEEGEGELRSTAGGGGKAETQRASFSARLVVGRGAARRDCSEAVAADDDAEVAEGGVAAAEAGEDDDGGSASGVVGNGAGQHSPP